MKNGYYQIKQRIKANAVPIDNKTKFVWDDDDYETYEEWHEYTSEELEIIEAAKNTMPINDVVTALKVVIPSVQLSNEQALKVSAFYPEWTVGTSYNTKDIAKYKGNLYQALQTSVAAEYYPPDTSTSLWKKIEPEDESGYRVWVQPLGATDAYAKGDMVSHNGYIWKSVTDNNVWEPGIYGWEKIKET